MRVDLRLLQLAREVDVDRLPLREDVEAGDARLAVAVARVLDAAEGQVHLGADRRGVDVEDARLELPHRRERLVDVLRVDGARQAVRHRVGHPDPFLERGDRNDRRDRSEDLFRRDAHLHVGVGEDGRLVEPPAAQLAGRELLPARHQSGALGLPDLDVLRHRLALLLGDARPHVDVGIEAVADAERFHAPRELVDELLVDRLVHEQARGRRAALAGRAERAPDRAVDGEIHVRVLHDEDRVLAAHLEVQPLERRSAGLRDPPADLGRARVGDDLDVWVLDERIADLAARAHDDVEDPRRKPRLLEDARERDDRGRSVRRRLDDDRVAGDERGHGLPRRDRHREVPRRHEGADAHRLADAHRELVRQLRGCREAEEPAPLARGEEGHVDRFLDVAPRLGEDLAHLARHQARELLLVALQDLARGVEHLGAPGRRRVLPAGERLLRRGDRGVDVGLAALREEADEIVAVRRVAVLEGLSRSGRHPLAADPVLLRLDCDLRGHLALLRCSSAAPGRPLWRATPTSRRSPEAAPPRR